MWVGRCKLIKHSFSKGIGEEVVGGCNFIYYFLLVEGEYSIIEYLRIWYTTIDVYDTCAIC